MERKVDVTSAETVADPVTASQPATAAFTSSRLTSPTTSLPGEGRFVPGTMLNGRYRVIALLGQGGMGEVYRATDLTLGQSVALKFLPESAAGNMRLLERFHSEVRVARQVSHPNVCRVYDIGETEGLPFISMEYIDGEDLASLLKRIGRLPPDKALETARKVCAGLAAAHDKGVIHRDLKPHNVMLNKSGEVVILDFGLAAVANSLSGAESRNGTPGYMSPEQLRGGEVTARSDIYALGLVLYELFTGKRPFDAKSLDALMDMQEAQQLASINSIASDVDPLVEKAILRCLEPDPAKRPHTPLAVSAALPGGDPLLAALAAGETPSPELVASSGKTEGLERHWALTCLVVIVLSLVSSPWLSDVTSSLSRADLPYPPDVLAEKAREVAVRLGYPNRPKDSAIKLSHREDYRQYLNQKPGQKRWQEWFAGEAPISLWYRESPNTMVPAPYGFISSDDPPFKESGMAAVTLDGHGRLRQFQAIPYDKGAESGGPVPHEAVFQALGFEPAGFSETMPTSTPALPADQLRAWTGPHPVLPDTEVRVEIGWWRNQVTLVNLTWPWTKTANDVAPVETIASRTRSIATLLIVAPLLVFGILLARRNWRSGRLDKRGAFRVGVTFFVFQMASWIGDVHPAGAQMLLFIINSMAIWLLSSVLVWVLYIALEPAVRSRWPHAIVTWNRLIAGRFTDPQVCAHILIGATVGVGVWSVTSLSDFWRVAHTGLAGGGNLSSTMGFREWLGSLGSNVASALVIGFLFFFLIFGLRQILRRDWLAAAVATLLFSLSDRDLFDSPFWLVDLAVALAVVGGLIFVLMRLGMVATASAVFFLNVLGRSTAGTDLKTWYAPAGLAVLGLLLAIALYSFYFSLGTRTLISDTSER